MTTDFEISISQQCAIFSFFCGATLFGATVTALAIVVGSLIGSPVSGIPSALRSGMYVCDGFETMSKLHETFQYQKLDGFAIFVTCATASGAPRDTYLTCYMPTLSYNGTANGGVTVLQKLPLVPTAQGYHNGVTIDVSAASETLMLGYTVQNFQQASAYYNYPANIGGDRLYLTKFYEYTCNFDEFTDENRNTFETASVFSQKLKTLQQYYGVNNVTGPLLRQNINV